MLRPSLKRLTTETQRSPTDASELDPTEEKQMDVKTNVKAGGGGSTNDNEPAIVVKSDVKAGG